MGDDGREGRIAAALPAAVSTLELRVLTANSVARREAGGQGGGGVAHR